jgi:hypothetical protein
VGINEETKTPGVEKGGSSDTDAIFFEERIFFSFFFVFWTEFYVAYPVRMEGEDERKSEGGSYKRKRRRRRKNVIFYHSDFKL